MTMAEIRRVVARVFKVPVGSIVSRNRTAIVRDARFAAMYLSRELLEHSYGRIASSFDRADHSTVISNIRRAGDLIEQDGEFAHKVAKCRARCRYRPKNGRAYRDEGEAMQGIWV